MSPSATQILSSQQINQRIERIAHEIYENNYKENEIILAGIANGGFVLAERITALLKKISPLNIQLVKIKIDKENPMDGKVDLDITEEDYTNKVIIIVDDVSNSGKTLIYSVKHFLKTPVKYIRTVVLVDRNHNRFPIQADYIGISLSTTLQEHIQVDLKKGKEAIYLQ